MTNTGVSGVGQSRADKNLLGYVGSVPGSKKRESDEWYTPRPYIDLCTEVLGSIQLDPFSSSIANQVVGAERYFSQENSAFIQDWPVETVFMNPPYGRGVITSAVDWFITQQRAYGFSAIVLVNNATEAKWFQGLLHCGNAVCFPAKRIAFWNADGKAISGNTRGQAFFYFGTNVERFHTVFSAIGVVARLDEQGAA